MPPLPAKTRGKDANHPAAHTCSTLDTNSWV